MSKRKIFKITLKNHFKGLYFALTILVGWLFYFFYEIYKEGIGNNLLEYSLIVLIITFLPVILIHLEYYLMNRGVTLKIDNKNQKLSYLKGKKELKISYSEIEKIELHKVKSYHLKEVRFFPTDFYHYAKIILKNNKIIYITSLLAPDFNVEMSNTIEIRQRFIAYIWSENLFIFQNKHTQDQKAYIPKAFKEIISKKPDIELIEIINSPKNYDEKFIFAAKSEIKERNIKNQINR